MTRTRPWFPPRFSIAAHPRRNRLILIGSGQRFRSIWLDTASPISMVPPLAIIYATACRPQRTPQELSMGRRLQKLWATQLSRARDNSQQLIKARTGAPVRTRKNSQKFRRELAKSRQEIVGAVLAQTIIRVLTNCKPNWCLFGSQDHTKKKEKRRPLQIQQAQHSFLKTSNRYDWKTLEFVFSFGKNVRSPTKLDRAHTFRCTTV